ncbi:MAG TPA: hypothetical protein HPP97_05165 [Desulfuromonadales bacterium]|nr:hypothetical protein [Desulfuromonadales bacterium]
MDTSSIAGSSLLLKTAQSQQALSATMMKQMADQQNKMAELLSQNTRQSPQPAANSGFNFSIFA